MIYKNHRLFLDFLRKNSRTLEETIANHRPEEKLQNRQFIYEDIWFGGDFYISY